jgi:hypothetical protein
LNLTAHVVEGIDELAAPVTRETIRAVLQKGRKASIDLKIIVCVGRHQVDVPVGRKNTEHLIVIMAGNQSSNGVPKAARRIGSRHILVVYGSDGFSLVNDVTGNVDISIGYDGDLGAILHSGRPLARAAQAIDGPVDVKHSAWSASG